MARRARARAWGMLAAWPGPGPRAGGLGRRVRCRLPGPRSLILRSLARGSLSPAREAGGAEPGAGPPCQRPGAGPGLREPSRRCDLVRVPPPTPTSVTRRRDAHLCTCAPPPAQVSDHKPTSRTRFTRPSTHPRARGSTKVFSRKHCHRPGSEAWLEASEAREGARPSGTQCLGSPAIAHSQPGCVRRACWHHQVLADGLPPSLLESCWAPWGETTAQARSSPGFGKWVKDFGQQPWDTAHAQPPVQSTKPRAPVPTPTSRRLPPQTTHSHHNFLAKTLGSPEGQWKFIFLSFLSFPQVAFPCKMPDMTRGEPGRRGHPKRQPRDLNTSWKAGHR